VGVGLILHVDNPSLVDVRRMAAEAEEAGADWLGVPDAFWWRDTWVLCAEAVRATSRLAVGPVVTNPYMRHPFVTAAAIATLQELAGDRVVVGLGAGGSEVAAAARVSRADAPERIVDLAALIRRVAAGEPLDDASGRSLEVPLGRPTIIVGGRGDRMLGAAGEAADAALLWAVPHSELERTVGLIAAGAHRRPSDLPSVDFIWAPLVAHDQASDALLRRAATYAVLNNRVAVRQRWGVNEELVVEVRRLLVAGDTATAEAQIPIAVVDDLATDADPDVAGAIAAHIGATSVALPVVASGSIGDLVAWGRSVLAAASR
jgi:5,10-methylenetetrahydromethanopterin reductase